MRKGTVIAFVFTILLAIAARAQESRSEVSAQGTVSLQRTAVARVCRARRQTLADLWWDTWLSAEGNYGFDRDTQKYFSNFAESRVKSDVHSATADLVVNLPLHERFWRGHPGEKCLPLRRGYRLRFKPSLLLAC